MAVNESPQIWCYMVLRVWTHGHITNFTGNMMISHGMVVLFPLGKNRVSNLCEDKGHPLKIPSSVFCGFAIFCPWQLLQCSSTGLWHLLRPSGLPCHFFPQKQRSQGVRRFEPPDPQPEGCHSPIAAMPFKRLLIWWK